jgi:hypothetical protein
MVNLADVDLEVEAGLMTDANAEMLKDSAWLQNRPRGAGHGIQLELPVVEAGYSVASEL